MVFLLYRRSNQIREYKSIRFNAYVYPSIVNMKTRDAERARIVRVIFSYYPWEYKIYKSIIGYFYLK
jgi:hypothetical protein